MRIREAAAADNQALIALTKAAPMQGAIAIRTDRDPDFFALARLRGETTVLVAEKDDDIVGCVSLSREDSFIDGERRRTGYFGDMKVHPRLAGGSTALRLMRALAECAQSRSEDLYFCVVADGNTRAEALLQGRAGFPAFTSCGSFRVYQLLALRTGRPSGNYRISEADGDEEHQAAAEIDLAWQRSRQFGKPADDPGAWTAATSPPPLTLIAKHGEEVCAAAQLVDTSLLKRNVLIDLSPSLRLATGILRGAAAVLPLPRPPRRGETISMLYLRRLAYGAGHAAAARDLILHARNECHRRGVTFLSVAFHEKEEHARLLAGLPKFVFRSNAFFASRSGDRDAVERIGAGIPYEDYAIV